MYTAHFTSPTKNYTLNTKHWALHTQHCRHHTTHCTLHTTYCTLHTSHYIMHTLHLTLHTAHYTLHTTHYILHTTHYTLHTTHYTVHTTHYTLHTTHYTLHTTHYTPGPRWGPSGGQYSHIRRWPPGLAYTRTPGATTASIIYSRGPWVPRCYGSAWEDTSSHNWLWYYVRVDKIMHTSRFILPCKSECQPIFQNSFQRPLGPLLRVWLRIADSIPWV